MPTPKYIPYDTVTIQWESGKLIEADSPEDAARKFLADRDLDFETQSYADDWYVDGVLDEKGADVEDFDHDAANA